jgi:hypothetical protein
MCAVSTVNNVFFGPSCNNVDLACYFGICGEISDSKSEMGAAFLKLHRCMGEQKSILVRDDQMVTVPFTRMCRKSVAWCGNKLVASLAS